MFGEFLRPIFPASGMQHILIPLVRCDTLKPYWNAELQQLKEDSVQARLAWTAA